MSRQGTKEYKQRHYRGKHLTLDRLKEIFKDTHMYANYLYKQNIPIYPGPMGYSPEFQVFKLKHDVFNLEEIIQYGGFKDPNNGSKDPAKLSLVWFSLAVAPEEFQKAEERLVKDIFPHQTQEQAQQESFLWKFASSPAFSEKSRYGSYRFTFTVQEVLKAYSEQFCAKKPPVMRVLRTSLYQQKVMYAVLVHSPTKNTQFEKLYPELTDNPNAICAYREGHFIWRPQAMCKTHRYKLIERYETQLLDVEEVTQWPQFYVWDQVAIALHVEGEQVLKFGSNILEEKLTFCKQDDVTVSPMFWFNSHNYAQDLVRKLLKKPNFELKEESSLEESLRALSLQDNLQQD